MKTLQQAIKEVYTAVAEARAIADQTNEAFELSLGDQIISYTPPEKSGNWALGTPKNWYSSNC